MESKLLYKLMDWEATMSKQPAFLANADAFSHNVLPPKQTSSNYGALKTSDLQSFEDVLFATF